MTEWRDIREIPTDPQKGDTFLLWNQARYDDEDFPGHAHEVSNPFYIAKQGVEGLLKQGYTKWLKLPADPLPHNGIEP